MIWLNICDKAFLFLFLRISFPYIVNYKSYIWIMKPANSLKKTNVLHSGVKLFLDFNNGKTLSYISNILLYT